MPKNGLPCLLMQVAGAVVFALVITLLVVKAADMLYGKEEISGRGYTVNIHNVPAAPPAVTPSKEMDIMPWLAKADLSLGKKLVKRCEACHSFEKGAPGSVGPNQYGLVGRKVAAMPGYDYSAAMKAKGGTWTFQALSDFLASPQENVPGTRMGVPGMERPEERAAVIAYINKTFSDKPLDIKEQ